MKKLKTLSKAEMKEVLGGKQYSGGIELCDASNGTLWTSVCYVNGMYEPPSHYFDVTTWDSGSPCGGTCPGECKSYYICNDQPVAV